ncbi:ATP-binding protein [Halobacteria archaeon AArc-m2/3/4]|uniref:histidine kinase n=2 Tax=Natronoglomus mannanivorans TaxID=2979990 RepID=A0AAP2Z2D6_9EURY|nr:ATP-binding protein [Halobacteria archaeon AArc-xg1-1]MCU4974918.1 ATP-binding protein [Halobacteria archaeon AArc-m2/3/4]
MLVILGGLYIVFALGHTFVPGVEDEPLGTDIAMAIIVGIPGFVLLYGGYRLPETDIRPEVYSVIVEWCLGGIGVMVGLLGLVALAAELRNPVQNILILTAIGSVAGFAAGTHNARTKTRELELEETIERLEASNERLEQFAYAASHDLQEPLRMVSSYLQLVERRAELSGETEEFLEYAVDGADRMREMIDGLLAYSRVDSRGSPLEPVDLDTVFEGVLEDMQLTIEECDAEVTSDSLPEVRGDAGQLRQLFQNLLDNAIEYRGESTPRIHVSAERTNSTWEVSVHDDGIGIAPDDQERVFDVFQRLHGREEHPGSGIGLALAERIVERHGGEIWVDSEPGDGSTFSFTLPAVNAQ